MQFEYNKVYTSKQGKEVHKARQISSVVAARYQKGVAAEKRMTDYIIQMMNIAQDVDFRIVEDVCYKHNGNYSQVDAVIVCRKGIFCVEYKSWRGQVYPTTTEFWRIVKDTRVDKFSNPVMQNAEHCRMCTAITRYSLKNIIDTSKINFRNLVVFDDDSSIMPGPYVNVMGYMDVPGYINKLNDEYSTEILDVVEKFLRHVAEVNKHHFDKRHKFQMMK